MKYIYYTFCVYNYIKILICAGTGHYAECVRGITSVSVHVRNVITLLTDIFCIIHRDELADSLRTKVFSVRQALGDKATVSELPQSTLHCTCT